MSSFRVLAFACALALPPVLCMSPAAAQTSPTPSPSPSASPVANEASVSAQDLQTASRLADPLAPDLTFSAEDEYTKSVDGPNNQVNLRAQIPLGFTPPIANMLSGGQALSLLKVKLPIVTTSPSNTGVDAITGAGDLSVAWLGGFGSADSRWAAGAGFKFPTGSGALGSGKWSAGPALGFTQKTQGWTLGFYTQTYISYAGTSARNPLAQTQISPSIQYAFADGWSLGNSEMQYTYDYYHHEFTNLPLGIRLAKRFKNGPRRVRVYVDAEENLAAGAGETSLTLRLGATWIYAP